MAGLGWEVRTQEEEQEGKDTGSSRMGGTPGPVL